VADVVHDPGARLVVEPDAAGSGGSQPDANGGLGGQPGVPQNGEEVLAAAEQLGAIPAGHPLVGVVHAAGTLRDGPVETMALDDLSTVLRPKVDAAWHLHEQTRHLDLPVFVLYSSLAGTVGTSGQANYAAANAFLDALARHRSSRGQTAHAIAWGWWDNAGMTAHLAEHDRQRPKRHRLAPMSVHHGLALFDAALGVDESAVVAGILEPVDSSAVAVRLDDEQSVVELVRAETASAFGHASADRVAPDAEFVDLGLDSLTSVELRNRLTAATGLSLTLPAIFGHPTPRELARHLWRELGR